MKKYAPLLVTLFVIMQIMAFVRIGALQNQLQNVSNQLSSVQSSLMGQISGLNSRLSTFTKEQGSILERFDYSLGALDRDTLTVPVTFTVVPKEVKADAQAVLYLGNEPVTMVKSGGAFVATRPVDIFASFDARVVLAESGQERTALLGTRPNLRERVLPIVYVRFEAGSGVGNGIGYKRAVSGESGEFTAKGHVYVEVKPVVGNSIEKARLVIDINGRTVSEKPINSGGLDSVVDERITLVAGQTLTMTLEATDNFGLVHKVAMSRFEIGADAIPAANTGWPVSDQATIVDRNGNVRFTPKG